MRVLASGKDGRKICPVFRFQFAIVDIVHNARQRFHWCLLIDSRHCCCSSLRFHVFHRYTLILYLHVNPTPPPKLLPHIPSRISTWRFATWTDFTLIYLYLQIVRALWCSEIYRHANTKCVKCSNLCLSNRQHYVGRSRQIRIRIYLLIGSKFTRMHCVNAHILWDFRLLSSISLMFDFCNINWA